MTTGITIERAGLFSTIQDRGRFGLRHLGIPWSGCMTPAWQEMANTLVGNDANHSVIECFEGGLQISINQPGIRIAVLAHPSLNMSVSNADESQAILPCRSYTLAQGAKVSLRSTGLYRHAVIAVAGLKVRSQLGSTSTYAKASLGGLQGSCLQAGDSLCIDTDLAGSEKHCTDLLEPGYASTQLRVVLGPQDEHFSTLGIDTFLSSHYELGADADRMGVRLSGPTIAHRDDAAKDPVSDTIIPGSIQVPGNGQPIVLLNDAHTAGGYPKIATVLSIDLPLLAMHRAGTQFSFKALCIDEAIDAVQQNRLIVDQSLATIKPLTNQLITSEELFATNLIDGVTDGHE